MSFRIEAARPEDAGAILQLIRGLAEYEKLSHMVVATERDVRRELFGDDAVIQCVVCWEQTREETQNQTRAVGFALFFYNFSTFLGRRGVYLEDLFVVPEARGRGYGKALIQHVARLAVERDCGRFEWAVLDWNQPAIEFYKSLGAELLPDWRICRLTGDALARFGARAETRGTDR